MFDTDIDIDCDSNISDYSNEGEYEDFISSSENNSPVNMNSIYFNNFQDSSNMSNPYILDENELVQKADFLFEQGEEKIYYDIDNKISSIQIINSIYIDCITSYIHEDKSVLKTIIKYLDRDPLHNDNDYIKKISNILYFAKGQEVFKKHLPNIKNEIICYIKNNYCTPPSPVLRRSVDFIPHLTQFSPTINNILQNMSFNNTDRYLSMATPITSSTQQSIGSSIFLENNNINLGQYENSVKLVVKQKTINKMKIHKHIKNDDTKCAICFDELETNDEILDIQCKHLFHNACITKWLTENSYKCPLCKEKVAKYIQI